MVLDGEDLSFLMEMLGGVGVKVHPVIAVKALFCVVWNICLLVAEVYGYQAGDA